MSFSFLGHHLLATVDVRNRAVSPVEVGSWNPIFYGRFIRTIQTVVWTGGISEPINSMAIVFRVLSILGGPSHLVVTPIYKPWKGHLEGKEPHLGDLWTTVINHLLTGTILQVPGKLPSQWKHPHLAWSPMTPGSGWFWGKRQRFTWEFSCWISTNLKSKAMKKKQWQNTISWPNLLQT